MTVPAIKRYAPTDMTDLNKIINLGDPTSGQDAATKRYVDLAGVGVDLALTGTATTDCVSPTQYPERAIDGDDTTIGLSTDQPHWLKVDLGSTQLCAAYRVFNHQSAVNPGWTLASSLDGSAWTTHVTHANGGAGNPDTGVIVFSGPIFARYWKFTLTNGTSYYYELGTLSIYVSSMLGVDFFAQPAVTLDIAANVASGTSGQAIQTDAHIIAFDMIDPEDQDFGDTADPGDAGVAARRNHRHGMPTLILSNYAATTAPGVTDDSAEGYSVGSRWINVTSDLAYTCVDSTDGAAVWILG